MANKAAPRRRTPAHVMLRAASSRAAEAILKGNITWYDMAPEGFQTLPHPFC